MRKTFLQDEKIKELTDFCLEKRNGICFVEGKTGFFKTYVVNESIANLPQDFLSFKVQCFESTTLDDIFLVIFEELKKYANQKKLIFTKIETNSLSQRINKYLNHITLPSVIVFDSFQNILNKTNQDEDDKEEIIRFISHLNTMNKFKIVIASTFFPVNTEQMFETNSFSTILKLQMEPLTDEQIAEYFSKENIEIDENDFDEFCKYTKGNPEYIYLSVNIVNTLNTSIHNLLDEFKNKNISFENYILQKLITFVPDSVKKSLFAFSFFNGGLPEEYLIKENFFSKDQIQYMLEKAILHEENGLVYMKSSMKKYLQKIVPNYEKIRINTLWKDFYISQLPLKPNNRVLLISRNTMRAQIQYHSSFIVEQRPQENDSKEFSLMSYLNSNITDWNLKSTNNADENTSNSNKKNRPTPPPSIEERKKKENLEKYALTKDEVALLSVPVDLRKKEEQVQKERMYRTFEQKEEELKQLKKGIEDLFELAKSFEETHNFENAASIYLNALNEKSDVNYHKMQPKILERLAFCCKKMNKTSEAIDFLNNLTELYQQRNDTEKLNETRLEIAQIYKETYRTNHARLIYENFVNKKSQASDKIILRSYIELAEIEDDMSNTDKAIDYYKKAFDLAENFSSDENISEIVAESYFKYALILDDFQNTQSALDYYQKCINTCKKPSIYLSCSYANVGEILREKGESNQALEYYKKSLKIDIKLSNHEGIYYTCLKIAATFNETDKSQVLGWLLKSLSAAKRTKDKLYIATAYKEIGTYYSQNNDRIKAQKAFALSEKFEEKQEQ